MSNHILRLRMSEDCWGILLADICSLIAKGGWVMDGEEELAEIFVSDLGWIKADLNDLNMTKFTWRELVVRWIWVNVGRIFGWHKTNTWIKYLSILKLSRKKFLYAPIATSSKCSHSNFWLRCLWRLNFIVFDALNFSFDFTLIVLYKFSQNSTYVNAG